MGSVWVNSTDLGSGGGGAPVPWADGRKSAGGVSGVCRAFEELLSDLEITEAQRAEASRQQQQVRAALRARLELIDAFLSGSYRRYTQIRPCDDIDLLVVLDAEWYQGPHMAQQIHLDAAGARAAIDTVFRALRDAYPRTELRRFSRGVQIQFAGTGIGFDVVPAFQDGSDNFWIPDTAEGRWVLTNPKAQQQAVSAANQGRCGQMLVPLVKLLKAWNDAHRQATKSSKLRGFHLEAMAYHGLWLAPESYPAGVALILEDAATRVLADVPDIWPLGEPATADLDWSARLEASSALRAAGAEARRAIEAESDGRADDAHTIWFALFGSRYPESGGSRAKAGPLSAFDALGRVRAGAAITASSGGIAAAAAGMASVRSASSHGGAVESLVEARLETPEPAGRAGAAARRQMDFLDREILTARRQFDALDELTPGEAVADPGLWPITERRAAGLYALLVGEQRTNLGRVHRIVVTVPFDMPATEPRVYVLDDWRRYRPTARGWARRRAPIHRWRDGALCTHAMRDRWDGRLVTALVYAADHLLRQDYYELTGAWVGRQIDARGQLVVNGRRPRGLQ